MRLSFPATLLAFLAILWVKAIYPPASGIADTDFYWHLTYGEWMLQHGTLPAGDVFSWTFPGAPYQLTQWLGELAMGAAYAAAGLTGTKALSVLLLAVTLLAAWRAAARYVHTSQALGLAFLCNLIMLISPMRPQLFSFAFLAIGMYLIVSWMETQRRGYLLAFPLLMALWVNLHGGFVIGLLLIGLTAAGVTAEAAIAHRLRDSLSQLRFVWLVVVLSALATLINPYGYKAVTTVLMIGHLRSSTVISEWMPVNLTTEIGWFYLLNLIPFVAIIAISGVRPRLTHGIIAAAFLVFGVLANRQVAMCSAVMAPLTAALMARTPQYRQAAATFGNPNRPLLHACIALVLAASLPWIVAMGDRKWDETMNLKYPVKATDYLVAHQLDDRVLSDTLEASYLIHRHVPVFIDGRMDLYRDGFFFSWYLASRAAPGWEALLAQHRPKALLLRVEMALRQAALASGQWKQVYEDEMYSVLVPLAAPLTAVPPATKRFIDDEGRMLRPYMP